MNHLVRPQEFARASTRSTSLHFHPDVKACQASRFGVGWNAAGVASRIGPPASGFDFRRRDGGRRLVQIIALVKPFRAQAVLAALESIEILGGTVREAMGYGRQKHRLHRYLGSEYNTSFLP